MWPFAGRLRRDMVISTQGTDAHAPPPPTTIQSTPKPYNPPRPSTTHSPPHKPIHPRPLPPASASEPRASWTPSATALLRCVWPESPRSLRPGGRSISHRSGPSRSLRSRRGTKKKERRRLQRDKTILCFFFRCFYLYLSFCHSLFSSLPSFFFLISFLFHLYIFLPLIQNELK